MGKAPNIHCWRTCCSRHGGCCTLYYWVDNIALIKLREYFCLLKPLNSVVRTRAYELVRTPQVIARGHLRVEFTLISIASYKGLFIVLDISSVRSVDASALGYVLEHLHAFQNLLFIKIWSRWLRVTLPWRSLVDVHV